MLLIERFNAEKRKAEAEMQYTKYREETARRLANANRNLIKSTRELEGRMASMRELVTDQSTIQLKQAIEEASSNNNNQNRKFVELPRSTYCDNGIRRCGTTHANAKQDDSTMTSTQLLLRKIESDTGVEANDLLRYFKNIGPLN